ncbi:unnamed protein product [Pseudo-nitzschia multistriata]|uniref:Uncharacterized protein n=1 Tax=Pseudo-nitzschia multistriata TaxID=183589 RepID=A0A448Z3W8_9STRA|nr:unnamed protein product [Pseudo-nitzschia multistriata]
MDSLSIIGTNPSARASLPKPPNFRAGNGSGTIRSAPFRAESIVSPGLRKGGGAGTARKTTNPLRGPPGGTDRSPLVPHNSRKQTRARGNSVGPWTKEGSTGGGGGSAEAHTTDRSVVSTAARREPSGCGNQ